MEYLYCITYDLTKEKNYSTLIDEIKRFPSWWHQTESVWFVVTSDSPIQIRERLRKFMASEDKIFVVLINNNNWAGYGFSKEEYDWLKNKINELNIK